MDKNHLPLSDRKRASLDRCATTFAEFAQRERYIKCDGEFLSAPQLEDCRLIGADWYIQVANEDGDTVGTFFHKDGFPISTHILN